jgi:calcineurin-like phosphoesterase
MFPVATSDVRLSGVLVEVDAATGKAVSVKRVHERLH